MRGDQLRGYATSAFFLVALLILPACVSTPTVAPPRAVAVTSLPLQPNVGEILPDGEETSYKVAFGIITVGELTYRVAHVHEGGAELLRLESQTQASAWLSAFLKIGGVTRSYVDRATMLPSSYYWITAEKDDPLIRTASFDHAGGRVFASSYQQKCLTTRTIKGQDIHDPVSAILLIRAIDFSRTPGEQLRLYLVEGTDLHLMTLKLEGREVLDADEGCRATRKISVRTDRLDCNGNLTGEEPYNMLLMWIEEQPPNAIAKIEGRVGGSKLKLALKHRVVVPSSVTSRPAGSATGAP
jgi:Protein of unknown function (DUF3108)